MPDFGRFWLPKCPPLGALLATKIDQKNNQKFDSSKCRVKIAPRSPQERPRLSQDAPRTPPESPRISQDASRTTPGCPQMPSRTLPNDLRCFSEASGPITFFGKINKFELVEKKSKTKSPQRSSAVVTRIGPHKNRKRFHNGRTPEGGGGGRAKRSSITR